MIIRVVTQNVMCWDTKGGEYEKRRVRIKRLFDRLDADLIGAQEVTPFWRGCFEDDLQGYDCVFRYRGKEDEAVPVYWKKSRFSAEESGYFWLSETPDVESYGPGAGCLRICTWAVLTERESGKRFLFANTHLDNSSEPARVMGIELIRDRLLAGYRDLPVVLTGDFNDVSYSKTVGIARSVLDDARLVCPDTDESNTHRSEFALPADASIDYVFVRGVNPLSFRVERECDGEFAQSDHYAVSVDFEL